MRILDTIPELGCPRCKHALAEDTERLICSACGNSYAIRDGLPCMLDADMERFAEEIAVQDRVAQEYESKRYSDAHARRYHEWWIDQMLACVRADGSILDNGCGIGALFERLPGRRVVGLDISAEMLRVASRHSDRLVMGNSQQLPFKAGSFDLVFCRSLLHHLPEPEAAVREMHAVLRPGGEVVLVDTNASLISSLPRRIVYRGEHFSDDHKNLSRRALERYLTPYFRIDKVAYFGYVAYPLLGFPDLLPVFRYVPFKSMAARSLMGLDAVLARIPFLRTQSWAILIKATRRDDQCESGCAPT